MPHEIGEQLDLLTDGRVARDAAVARVNDNVDDWWRDCADRAIRDLAATGQPFTAFQLEEMGVPAPDHPNRVGGRFHAAARAGLIQCCGFAPSMRPTTKASIVRVWRGVTP